MKEINLKLVGVLWAGCVFGSIAILPFLFLVQGNVLRSLEVSSSQVVLLQIVQAAVLFGIASFLGFVLAKKVGFTIPILEAWIEKKPKHVLQKAVVSTLIIAIPLGFLAGFLILVIDGTLPLLVQNSLGLSVGPVSFSTSQLQPAAGSISATSITPELWQGFLAAFYGAINEEILMRLFIMSFLVWIISFVIKRKGGKVSPIAVWIAIGGAAMLFGIGHLPFTATITVLSPYIITRALLLNGVGGIIFGWLFWKKGLEAAMVAHFTTDIFLFVILPLTV
jgi:membrane protease YdiL (CAAX protease family)